MPVAALTWLTGAAMLGLMLRWYVRRGSFAAAAMLLVLVPQVYAHPLLFILDLHHPIPSELFRRSEWDLVTTALLISMGWMLLIFLTHLLFVRPLVPLARFVPQANEAMNSKLLLAAVIFTTVVGAVLTGLFVLRAGSIGNFMLQVKVEKALSGEYVIREISVVAAVFAAIAIVHYEKRFRSAGRNAGDRMMVWFSVFLFLVNIAFNYFWGNRYNIAMLSLGLGLAWHWYVRRFSVVKILVLVLLAGASLQSLKVLRTESVGEALNRDVSNTQPFWDDVSTSLHFNQFDAFMLALRDAGTRFEFREGRDFKNGLLAWVPRQYYPEKETFHVGGWFRRVYQPERVNGWPVTTMGDWYVNFGSLGIVFGGILSGFLAAFFDAAYRNVRDSAWQAAAGPALALLIFDGGVDPGLLQRLVLDAVPVLLLAVILNLTRTRQAAPALPGARGRLSVHKQGAD